MCLLKLMLWDNRYFFGLELMAAEHAIVTHPPVKKRFATVASGARSLLVSRVGRSYVKSHLSSPKFLQEPKLHRQNLAQH